MSAGLAEVLEAVLGELEVLGELDRAALITRLIAELPHLVEIYTRQRGLRMVADHVVIVDERQP